MGRSGKIILTVTILAVVLFAYVYITAQLSATMVSVSMESAADRRSAFEELAEALNNGDMTSVQFSTLDSTDPADYTFITYTAELQGYNPLPAEWAVMAMSPAPGDVVLVQGAPQTVPPFGKATVSATLLTRAGSDDTDRTLWLEYYVLGRCLNAAVKVR